LLCIDLKTLAKLLGLYQPQAIDRNLSMILQNPKPATEMPYLLANCGEYYFVGSQIAVKSCHRLI